MLSQYLLKLKKLPETNKQKSIENNWIKKIILMPRKGFVFFFLKKIGLKILVIFLFANFAHGYAVIALYVREAVSNYCN